MLNKIGIGITTKDRWDDLQVTLTQLEAFGLSVYETIVMDDASVEPASVELRARFSWVRFERSEKSRFVPGGRNYLASLLTAPYFLQLDDDSFPVRGDLAEAAAWLERHDDALALAFVVNSEKEPAGELPGLAAEPFRCHFFIGCAGLIKRELFLELGGYEESFEYNCEEIALALHAQLRGRFVYQYPGVVVQHNRSPLARNQKRRFSLLIRNELLLAGLHYPLLFLLLRWPVFLAKALMFRWASIDEIVDGVKGAIRLYPAIWPQREPVPVHAFLAWKKLPSPIEFK